MGWLPIIVTAGKNSRTSFRRTSCCSISLSPFSPWGLVSLAVYQRGFLKKIKNKIQAIPGMLDLSFHAATAFSKSWNDCELAQSWVQNPSYLFPPFPVSSSALWQPWNLKDGLIQVHFRVDKVIHMGLKQIQFLPLTLFIEIQLPRSRTVTTIHATSECCNFHNYMPSANFDHMAVGNAVTVVKCEDQS